MDKQINVVTFGEFIRLLREEKKLSLKYVSNKIGIDTSLLGKLERNKRRPTSEQIIRISDFFQVEKNILKKHTLSDQLACQIIVANVDLGVLEITENKIKYLQRKDIKI